MLYCEEGRFFVVAGDQSVLEIWTLKKGRVGSISVEGIVKNIAVSPDGRVVAAGCSSGQVHLWLLPNAIHSMGQSPLGMVVLDGPSAVCGLDMDMHGRYLVSGHDDGVALVWDLVDGSRGPALSHHGGNILDVCFDNSGPITSSEDHILRYWNIEGHVAGLVGGVGELFILVTRQRDVFALSRDGQLHHYRNKEHQSDTPFDDSPIALTVNQEGMIVVAGANGKVYIYPTGLNGELITLDIGDSLRSVATSGTFIVVGTSDGGLEILKRV